MCVCKRALQRVTWPVMVMVSRCCMSPSLSPPAPQVYGLPTLMVFEGGELAPNSHREGAVTKAILEKYIKQHVTSLISA